MREWPRVSIIIPVFNDQDGLLRCLSALEATHYPINRIETLVVDNGSEPPVHVPEDLNISVTLINCPRPGSYAARNDGIKHANGEVLAFTDADCEPDPNWLPNGIRSLAAGDGNIFIGGDVIFSTARRTTTVTEYQRIVGFNQRYNIEKRQFAATANLFITSAQIKTTHVFNEELLSGGDLEWCWRAQRHGFSVRFEPKAIVRTTPRETLRAAIRQARRVSGGRSALQLFFANTKTPDTICKKPKAIESLKRIWAHKELSPWGRVNILFIAGVIRLAGLIESHLVALGFQPERR